MQRVALLLSAALFPAVASAQDATFDGFTEGVIAMTFTEGGITFNNLDVAFPGQPGFSAFICEQADGDLAGQPGFTAPNCLGSMGYSPGPGASFGRMFSFEMTTGQVNTLGRLELWDSGTPGNTISLEAYMGGTLVNSHTIASQFAFPAAHYTLTVSGVPFDMLRLQGAGSQEGGCFFALVDGVHISGSPTTGTTTCAGDGSGTACPCGNNSPTGSGEGCLSSLGVGGKLHAIGAASLSGDTVVLHGEQMPNAPCLYFQGTTALGAGGGVAFGDGLRCAGGSTIRLGTKTNAAGASQYPAAGDPTLSVRGQVTVPGSRVYQTWYRNAATFCTGSTFNLTNGLSITWGA